MTIDQLRMLEKIVEKGSILAGAKVLYRSQSTVSVAMKKLEKEFGVKIFSRDQYRASLTPDGQVLFKKAQMILSHVTAFEALAKQLGEGIESEICVAYASFVQISSILQILKKYKKEYPHIKFTLSTEQVEGGIERLLDGDADLAIIPVSEENPKLESIFYKRIPFISVSTPDFFPEAITQGLNQKDLKNYTQIVVHDSSRHSPLKNFGVIEGGHQWFVTDLFTKKQIIVEGIGFGRLPEYMIEEELQNGNLVPLKVKDYETTFQAEVRVVRRNDQPLGNVASRLWNELSTAV